MSDQKLMPQEEAHTSQTDSGEKSSIPSHGIPRTPPVQLSLDTEDRVFPIRSVMSITPEADHRSRAEALSDTLEQNLASATSSDCSDSESALLRFDRQKKGKSQAKSSKLHDRSSNTGTALTNVGQKASYTEVDIPSSTKAPTETSQPQQPLSPGSSATMVAQNSLATDEDFGGGIVTTRFKYVTTEEGHSVITGREGEALQRCEDEPIHVPGAVQGFGALVVLREESQAKLVVRIASENTSTILGFPPRDLFDLDSFCDILSDDHAENLWEQIDFVRDEGGDPARNGPEVFSISVRTPRSSGRRYTKLWCAIHTNDRNPGFIICEFELEDDPYCPIIPPGETSRMTVGFPPNTLNSQPTPDELLESTTASNKHLRVLRSARSKRGEAAAMEVFSIMSQIQDQFASAPTLETFLKVLIGIVKELTGFHRVMIYQFDPTWNGRVVAELVDPRATKDLYRGLNFPATDIPKQARDLYKINKVRLLYNRDQETARLVCRTLEDLETPLDMTHTFLRAISPIHLKYLSNMEVRASMSISINAFDELWGLIACHSYGESGMRVAFPIRKMCRLIGDSASRNIERLSYASRLQARKLINTIPTTRNPSGYIIASSEDLLALFNADFGLLSIRDEAKILGGTEQSQEALVLLEFLRIKKFSSVTVSQCLTEDYRDLQHGPGLKDIAGMLLVPLTHTGSDFIVFFRKAQLREVKWAGNPYEKVVKEGTRAYLEPRKSFQSWTENVVGQCREWYEDTIESAAVLCLVYGKFIEVWRRKEDAMRESHLTKTLLANSAHEVRTPLNAIINYLEMALEGSLDSDTRESLKKSHSASKSLIYVVNDLLDLTKLEEGHDLIKVEDFDLVATVTGVSEMFQRDAERKSISLTMTIKPDVPRTVGGDQRRVRQAISNLTANAIQNTSAGGVGMEISLVSLDHDRVEIDIAVVDTGSGMSQQRLDSLFSELEEVEMELEDGPDTGTSESPRKAEKSQEHKRTLGLGLALVARVIRNMNGQLRLSSELGKGSRFVIRLPFTIFSGASTSTDERNVMGSPQLTPEIKGGDFMLVDALSPEAPSLNRSHPDSGAGQELKGRPSLQSMGSMDSWTSHRSGKSVVNSLIDAIQEPLAGAEPAPPTSIYLDTRGTKIPGQEEITDSKTPLKPVKISQSDEPASVSQPSEKSNIPSNANRRLPEGGQSRNSAHTPQMEILVAEDDPINSKIMKKRLEKIRHNVHLTVNGADCAALYNKKPGFFDAVLMDMQMPILGGLGSTEMIRACEESATPQEQSARASLNSRVPIFAVSASLLERDLDVYVKAGFDGWILKPVDFKRLNELLNGIVDDTLRESCLYKPGEWNKGGWFGKAPELDQPLEK
ncbi:MAG: Light-sensor Protein kinase [Vezdaea aestivalis]|nr:MAG: Light-sensor Protein kinase [Vezdaea aestivalis]